ncbi:MAG: anaerobic ribonucleoside-triphosphate reductase activating protein [Elusimicrobiota bacterium]
MKFRGIKKSSLIDWPCKVVSTIFTGGCNFRCGWCQNPDLVFNKVKDEISVGYLINYFEKNRKWLDGICVTGGEPLINKDLEETLKEFKQHGFKIKLDTNGSNPGKLKKLIQENIVDFVSLDIKGPLDEDYSKYVGVKVDNEVIKESIRIVKDTGIEYEFRTTVVPGLLTGKEIQKIGRYISPADNYILQKFRGGNTLDSRYSNKTPYTDEEMKKMAEKVSGFAQKIQIR